MWQRTPRASSIGSVIMHPRDKRNGEQWRTCSNGTQSAPWRENEALLYVVWIRTGCKTAKRWVILYSVSRTKTWAASPIKAERYRFWLIFLLIIILMKNIVMHFFPSNKIIQRWLIIIVRDYAFFAFRKKHMYAFNKHDTLWRDIAFRYKS